jgi:hypothetical protein
MISELIQRWFGRRAASHVEQLPDRVWMSAAAKYDAIRRDVEARMASGTRLIALVAHFPDVRAELEGVAADYAASGVVRAVLARELSSGGAAQIRLTESDMVDLLVAERHPLASEDTALLAFAEALPCRCRIVHHLSLDDALLQFVGAGQIRPLLEKLGASEAEPISHPLINRSVQGAQAKIKAGSLDPYAADSAARWLELNVRR